MDYQDYLRRPIAWYEFVSRQVKKTGTSPMREKSNYMIIYYVTDTTNIS